MFVPVTFTGRMWSGDGYHEQYLSSSSDQGYASHALAEVGAVLEGISHGALLLKEYVTHSRTRLRPLTLALFDFHRGVFSVSR